MGQVGNTLMVSPYPTYQVRNGWARMDKMDDLMWCLTEFSTIQSEISWHHSISPARKPHHEIDTWISLPVNDANNFRIPEIPSPTTLVRGDRFKNFMRHLVFSNFEVWSTPPPTLSLVGILVARSQCCLRHHQGAISTQKDTSMLDKTYSITV